MEMMWKCYHQPTTHIFDAVMLVANTLINFHNQQILKL